MDKYISSLLLFILIGILNTALGQTSANIDHQYDTAIELENDYDGYLLLQLEVAGNAPSIEIRKVYEPKRLGRPLKISLDVNKKILLYPLKQGKYQIVTVNTPFYNMPYKLDTSDRANWRFSILKNQVNYLGKLFIEQERTSRFVNVKLVNRLAEYLSEIKSQHEALLSVYPFRMANNYKDNFYELYYSNN